MPVAFVPGLVIPSTGGLFGWIEKWDLGDWPSKVLLDCSRTQVNSCVLVTQERRVICTAFRNTPKGQQSVYTSCLLPKIIVY
jgi:hypothetical protein